MSTSARINSQKMNLRSMWNLYVDIKPRVSRLIMSIVNGYFIFFCSTSLMFKTGFFSSYRK